jgi:hypothetical protein
MALRPRANPPICWLCDRRLAYGGRRYKLVLDLDGHEHPAHVWCEPEPEVTARPTG